MKGWVRVDRKLFEFGHDFWDQGTPYSRREAWVDLICMADHETGIVEVSTRFLEGRWRWTRSKVQRFLRALKKRGSITPKSVSTNRSTNRSGYLLTGYVDRHAPRSASVSTNRSQVNNRTREQELLLYEASFERVWKRWLDVRRRGGNPKASAKRNWLARCRAGVSVEQLELATENYLAWVEQSGKAGSPYIKMASTFYGPDEHWREHLTATRSEKDEEREQLQRRREREVEYAQEQARLAQEAEDARQRGREAVAAWYADLPPEEKARFRLQAQAAAAKVGIESAGWIKAHLAGLIEDAFAVSQHP